jgi:hypothetical protein
MFADSIRLGEAVEVRGLHATVVCVIHVSFKIAFMVNE